MTALLEIDSVSKSFGAVVTAREISFSVAEGSALAVVGPNGAGKSTLLSLVTGALHVDGGTIRYDGRDLGRTPAPARSRMGIARTHQVPRPFAGMSVFENALVAASFGAGLRARRAQSRAREALVTTGMIELANRDAGSLRLLDRKRLELARALATQPRLLLLDEIAGGLSEQELPQLIELIALLKQSGVTIVWIEHVVHALFSVADSMLCLASGRIVAQGEPREVLADPEVVAVYLGSTVDAGDVA